MKKILQMSDFDTSLYLRFTELGEVKYLKVSPPGGLNHSVEGQMMFEKRCYWCKLLFFNEKDYQKHIRKGDCELKWD